MNIENDVTFAQKARQRLIKLLAGRMVVIINARIGVRLGNDVMRVQGCKNGVYLESNQFEQSRGLEIQLSQTRYDKSTRPAPVSYE